MPDILTECVSSCLLKKFLKGYLSSQSSQAKGLSLVWTTLLSFKCDLYLKNFHHTSHDNIHKASNLYGLFSDKLSLLDK